MTPNQVQDPNEELMQNLIRQKRLESAFGNAGIPQTNSREPDVFHHVQHTFDSPQASPQNSPPGQLDPNQEAALNQTGVPPSPSPQGPTPIPKVGPMNPNTSHPMESAYQQALMNEPMHADYHPSGMRKFASVMGGIGAGIISRDHVKGGMDVAGAIKDAPFNEQHSNWKQFATNKGTLATEEIAGEAAADKSRLTDAQIGEQNSLQGLHEHESQTYHPTTQAGYQADQQSKLSTHTTTHEAKLKDGRIVTLVQTGGIFTNPETKETVDRAAIDEVSDPGKSLKQTKDEKFPAALQASVKARQVIAEGINGTNKYDQATLDAAQDYIQELHKAKDPTAAFGAIVEKTNKERKLAGKPEMSSDELIKLQKTLQPEQKPTQAPFMVDDSNRVFKPKVNEILPPDSRTLTQEGTTNIDTSTTRTMKEAAPKVIQLMDKLDREVDINVKALGPSAGRWADFWTGKVGTPNPQFTTLRTNNALAKTLLMRMHLGARGGQGMYDHFSNMIDIAGQSPENLHAAYGAIREYANDVSKSSHTTSSEAPTEEYVRDPKTNKLVLKKTGARK